MSEDTGLLLTGGEGPSRRMLEAELPVVRCAVAADSGYLLARRLGLEPDFLVGDFDSLDLDGEVGGFPPERIRLYPAEKDETDTEIGLRLLWELGFRRTVIAGGGGGRLDHLLGILMLFQRENPPAVWYTSREQIQLVAGERIIRHCQGQTVSFFPIGGPVSGLASRGLKWPLNGLEWGAGDMGISNVFTANRCTVSVGRGRLLMVRSMVAEG